MKQMCAIQKTPLPFQEDLTTDFPKGAQFLNVQMVNGKPNLFFLNPDINSNELESRGLIARKNGSPFKFKGKESYIGTFQVGFTGKSIYHLFEVKGINHETIRTYRTQKEPHPGASEKDPGDKK